MAAVIIMMGMYAVARESDRDSSRNAEIFGGGGTNVPRQKPFKCIPSCIKKSKMLLVLALFGMIVASVFLSVCRHSKDICSHIDNEQFYLWVLCISTVLLTVILVNKKYGEETAQRIASICLTFILIASALITSLTSKETRHYFISSKILAVSMVMPYAGMCCVRKDKLNTMIPLIFVLLPAVISSIVEYLPTILDIPNHRNFRIGLLLPAMSFACYEIAVLAYRNTGYNRTLVKTLLRGSGAAMLVGASTTGTSLALDLHNSSIVVGGAILTFAGGLAFNACLVVQRLQNPKPRMSVEVCLAIDEKEKSFGFLAVIIMICGDLLGIYLCLANYRIAVVLPIILLVCLYFALIYLHDSHSVMTINFFNFFLMFVSFAATVCIHANNTPIGELSHNEQYYNTPSRLEAYLKDRDELKIRSMVMWFAALECSLVFIYFMMTTLVQAETASEWEDNAEYSREMEHHPLADAAPITKTTLAPSAVVVSVAATDCSSSASRHTANAPRHTANAPRHTTDFRRYSVFPPRHTASAPRNAESNRWRAPTHVTLNLPD